MATDWDPATVETAATWHPETWAVCGLIWLFCAPLALLSRPGQRLRTYRDGAGESADLGEENNHFGRINITGAERDHG